MTGPKFNPILAGNFRGAIVGPLMINLVSAVLQPLAWPLILVVSSVFCFWLWSRKPKPAIVKTYDAQGNEIDPTSPIQLPGQEKAPPIIQPPPHGFVLPPKLRKTLFFTGLTLLIASLITGVLACQRGNSMSQPTVDWIVARFDRLDEGQESIKTEQEKTTSTVAEVYELVQLLVNQQEQGQDGDRPAPQAGQETIDNLALVLGRYAASIEAEGGNPRAWLKQLRAGELEELKTYIDQQIETGQADALGLYLARYYIAANTGDQKTMLAAARVVAALRPDDGGMQELYAEELYRNDLYERSIHQSREAIRVYRKTRGSGEIGIPFMLDTIGSAYHLLEDDEAALQAYREAERAWPEVDYDDEEFVLDCHAATIDSIGHILWMQKKVDESVEAYRRLETVYRDFYGDNHDRVAETLSMIAFIYNTADRYTQSIRYARKAEEVYRELYGDEHATVAGLLYDIGMAQYWSDDLKGALESLQEAKQVWDKVSPEEERSIGASETIAKIKQELNEE